MRLSIAIIGALLFLRAESYDDLAFWIMRISGFIIMLIGLWFYERKPGKVKTG
jgi:ABC-type nickel/cobalt efflux system permease component RcnA